MWRGMAEVVFAEALQGVYQRRGILHGFTSKGIGFKFIFAAETGTKDANDFIHWTDDDHEEDQVKGSGGWCDSKCCAELL